MELTVPDFVLAVLLCSGCAVLAMASVSRWLHAREEARAAGDRLVCRLCLHAFVDEGRLPRGRVIDCPVCGTANEKGG